MDQVKRAEKEYRVVAASLAHYRSAVASGLVKLPLDTSPRVLQEAHDQAEATYLIRMWAAFEMALRSYHEAQTSNEGMRTVDLINWTAGVRRGRAISGEILSLVHEVRIYRNALVHGNLAPPVSIEEARKRLNTMLHCLPLQW